MRKSYKTEGKRNQQAVIGMEVNFSECTLLSRFDFGSIILLFYFILRLGVRFIYLFIFYSYLHTMFGSFLPPFPHLPLNPPPVVPSLSPHPLATRQKLFCPYL
jgi:hypothetical protein